MTRDQKMVGIGAASGVAAMIVAIVGIYQLWPTSPSLVDISSRLAYALQANAFAVIPLLAGIMTVGNNRFFSEAIDPDVAERRCNHPDQWPRRREYFTAVRLVSSSDDSA